VSAAAERAVALRAVWQMRLMTLIGGDAYFNILEAQIDNLWLSLDRA